MILNTQISITIHNSHGLINLFIDLLIQLGPVFVVWMWVFCIEDRIIFDVDAQRFMYVHER